MKRTKAIKEKKVVKKIIRKKAVKASNARVVKTQKAVTTSRTKKTTTTTKKVAVKPKSAAKIVAKRVVKKNAAIAKKAVRRTGTKATTGRGAKAAPKAVAKRGGKAGKATKATAKIQPSRPVPKKKTKVQKPKRSRAAPAKKDMDNEAPAEDGEPAPAVLKKTKEKTHRVAKSKPAPKPKPAPEHQVVKRIKWEDGQMKTVEMRLNTAPPVQKSPASNVSRRRGDKNKLNENQVDLDNDVEMTPTTSRIQTTKIGDPLRLSPGASLIDPMLVNDEDPIQQNVQQPQDEEFVVPDSEPEHLTEEQQPLPQPIQIEEDDYQSEDDDYANDLNFVKWPSTVARAYGIPDHYTGMTRYRKIGGYYQKITEFDHGPLPDEPSSKFIFVKVPRKIRIQQQSQWESDQEQEIIKATNGPPQYVRIGQSYVLYTKEVALGKLGKARTLYMRHHGRYKPWKPDGPLPRKSLKEKLKLKQKRLKPPPRETQRNPPAMLSMQQEYTLPQEGPALYERPDYRPSFRSSIDYLSGDDQYDTYDDPYGPLRQISSDELNRNGSLKRKFDIDSLLNENEQAKRARYMNPDEERSFNANPFAMLTDDSSNAEALRNVTDPRLTESEQQPQGSIFDRSLNAIAPGFANQFDSAGGFGNANSDESLNRSESPAQRTTPFHSFLRYFSGNDEGSPAPAPAQDAATSQEQAKKANSMLDSIRLGPGGLL